MKELKSTNLTDLDYMRLALLEAQKASRHDEVPIGAIVVLDGRIIAHATNKRRKGDILGHAEVIALKKASRRLRDWRLQDCDLYVTLEPCAMCVGVAVNARIRRIIFGAYDLNAGCCGSVIDLTKTFKLNHTVTVTSGIMQEECSKLISLYFANKRKKAKSLDKKINKKI
ncbi:MAG: tRNA adenosine(34) deaminase TadA [Clostridia bacterium]